MADEEVLIEVVLDADAALAGLTQIPQLVGEMTAKVNGELTRLGQGAPPFEKLSADAQKTIVSLKAVQETLEATQNKLASLHNFQSSLPTGVSVGQGTAEYIAGLDRQLAALQNFNNERVRLERELQSNFTGRQPLVQQSFAAGVPSLLSTKSPDQVAADLGIPVGGVRGFAQGNQQAAAQLLADSQTAEQRIAAQVARLDQIKATRAQVGNEGGGNAFGGGAFSSSRKASEAANGGDGGKGGGFLSNAIGDFGGIAKYVLAYQALSDIQRVLKDSVTETINFERGVTNLSLALGTSRDNARALASTFGDTVAKAGLGPSQGAAFAATFVGPFGRPGQDNTALGQQGANLGAQLAILSGGKDALSDLQQATAATRGFGGTARDVSRTVSAASAASQGPLSSSDPANILPALAQLSDLFQQAGFNQEQGSNIIANVRARTGESPAAVGGELQRFLGREGASAFQQVFARAGVDTSQNFSSELSQLAPIFQRASPQERASIVSTIGGGRAGPAATALLETLAESNAQALKQLTQGGSADRAQSVQQNDIKGTIDQVVGAFKNLEKALGESGLLFLFGALIKTAGPVITGFTELLNAIQPVSQYFVGLAEVLGVIAGFNAISKKLGGAVEADASKVVVEAKALETTASREAATSLGFFSKAVTTATELTVRGAEAALASSFVGGKAGLLNAALVGAIGVGVVSDVNKLQNGQLAAGDAGAALFGSRATSSDQVQALAKEFSKASADINIANQGILGRAIQGADKFLGIDTAATGRQDQRLSQQFANAAKQEEDLRANAVRTGSDASLAINLQNQTGVADGLKRLTDSGVDARTQIDILVRSLTNLAQSGSAAGRVLGGPEASTFALKFGPNLNSALSGRADQQNQNGGQTLGSTITGLLNPFGISSFGADSRVAGLINGVGSLFGLGGDTGKTDPGAGARAKALTDLSNDKGFQDSITGDVQTFLSANSLTKDSREGLINLLQARAAATKEFKSLDTAGRDALNAVIRQQVGLLQGDITNQIRPEITTTNALEALKQAPTLAKTAGGISAVDQQLKTRNIGSGTDTAQIVDVKEQIVEINRIIDAARATGKVNDDDLKIDQAKLRELAVQLNNLNAQQAQSLAALATSAISPFRTGARLDSQISGVVEALKLIPEGDVASRRPLETSLNDLRFQRINQEVARQDAVRTAQVGPGQAVGAAQALVDNATRDLNNIQAQGAAGGAAEATALATLRAARQGLITSQVDQANALVRDIDPRRTGDLANAAVAAAIALRDAVVNKFDKNGLPTTEFAQRDAAVKAAQAANDQSGTSKAIAFQDAFNVRIGDSADTARQAVFDATVQLNADAAVGKTVQYFQDLRKLKDAQFALGQAIGLAAKNTFLLAGDQTNPVTQAAATLQEAQATLARDKKNGTGNLQTDQLAVNTATQGLAATKLTQQLGDERNLFELRQISGATYLQFLEKQEDTLRNQLKSTKLSQEGRRQLFDQLVGVDKEILGLNNQLQGQFNLGTIKVPTIFEARRSLLDPTAGGGGQVTNYITISGADTAMVKQVITNALGPNAVQTRSPTAVGRKI